MAQLLIKLKKKSIFKGKLPLIFFNFENIGIFFYKFPFNEDSDDVEEPKKCLQRKIFEKEEYLLQRG